jgi:hypothetical protein
MKKPQRAQRTQREEEKRLLFSPPPLSVFLRVLRVLRVLGG